MLAYALGSVPRFDANLFDDTFGVQLEDSLLMLHLSTMAAKTQLDLCDSLTKLF